MKGSKGVFRKWDLGTLSAGVPARPLHRAGNWAGVAGATSLFPCRTGPKTGVGAGCVREAAQGGAT